MKVSDWISLAAWTLLVPLSMAEEIVYVTDLTIFTLLAPCVQSAISGVIEDKTNESCGEAVTDLQTCVCSKNNNHDDVLSSISNSVSFGCGSTASEDQKSASDVFDKYCDPGADVEFPTPTKNVVEAYPTDMKAYFELAPCAQYGVSWAMQEMTGSLCPEPASLLAPCVCGKNQNSMKASQIINSSVKQDCHNGDDVTSAQEFLAAYCAMTAGTTSFPKPSLPPGDMTYYITALPQFSSLVPCAQSAFEDALYEHSQFWCPEGPKAFAGCACTKPSMSSIATSRISTAVKASCDATAIDDVSSAISVWEFYCSAAADKVTASGITESISQPEQTGDGASDSDSGEEKDDDTTDGGGTNIGAIAGGVVAGVVVLLLIVAVVWYLRRKKAVEKQTAAAGAAVDANKPAPYFGKPELAGNAVVGTMPAVSPVSTQHSNPFHDNNTPTPPPPMPELHSGGHWVPPELANGQTSAELRELPGQASVARQELAGGTAYNVAPPANRPELGAGAYGNIQPQELHGQQQPPYANYHQGAPMQLGGYQQSQPQPQPPQAGYYPAGQQQGPPAPHNGMGWQAGPVSGFEEPPTQFHAR